MMRNCSPVWNFLRSDVQPEGGLVVGLKVPDKAPDVTIPLSMDMVKRRY